MANLALQALLDSVLCAVNLRAGNIDCCGTVKIEG